MGDGGALEIGRAGSSLKNTGMIQIVVVGPKPSTVVSTPQHNVISVSPRNPRTVLTPILAVKAKTCQQSSTKGSDKPGFRGPIPITGSEPRQQMINLWNRKSNEIPGSLSSQNPFDKLTGKRGPVQPFPRRSARSWISTSASRRACNGFPGLTCRSVRARAH